MTFSLQRKYLNYNSAKKHIRQQYLPCIEFIQFAKYDLPVEFVIIRLHIYKPTKEHNKPHFNVGANLVTVVYFVSFYINIVSTSQIVMVRHYQYMC